MLMYHVKTSGRKHDGSLPLVSVNSFLGEDHGGEITTTVELIRSAEEEMGQQIASVRSYQQNRNATALPPSPVVGQGPEERGQAASGLAYIQSTARKRENLFAPPIKVMKTRSRGKISHSPFEVGVAYRRNMLPISGSGELWIAFSTSR